MFLLKLSIKYSVDLPKKPQHLMLYYINCTRMRQQTESIIVVTGVAAIIVFVITVIA